MKRHRVTLKCLLPKSHYEKATYYTIPTTWHSGKGKTIDSNRISGWPGSGRREGWIGRGQRIFKAVKLFRIL